MDALEERLRDRFRDRAFTPPAAEMMLARVHRRRARNRLLSAAALVAVLLVTASAYLTLGRAPARPAPADPVLPSGLRPAAGAYPYFTDPDHGFALGIDCDADPCSAYVASTSDAGLTWQTHPIAGVTTQKDLGRDGKTRGPADVVRASLLVFDRTHLVLRSWEGTRRWISQDGGSTWAEGASTPAPDPIDEVPSGARVRQVLDTESPLRLIVTTPEGNDFYLRHAPPVTFRQSRAEMPFSASDGSLWLEGSNHDSHWLFVSRDRGRSWQQLPDPPGIPPTADMELGTGVSTLDGRNVYWSSRAAGAAWRTADDGAHWTAVDLGSVPAMPPLTGARHVRTNGMGLEHSADGVHWTELRF